MRVEMRDSTGHPHVIDSADPGTIGRWFAEKAEVLMSANIQFNHPVSLDIWPSTDHERNTIGQWSIQPLTADGVLELTSHLLNVAGKLQEMERGA